MGTPDGPASVNTAVWTTAITGLTAIGVAALAPMVAARLTRRQWQRDQKVRAYTHLMSVHRLLMVTDPDLYTDSPIQAKMAGLGTEQILQRETALAEVELVCPDNIRLLVEQLGEIALPAGRADPLALQEAWDAVINAMRADLGTK
jgi:hypothetical protein